jgi:hypothetical protein
VGDAPGHVRPGRAALGEIWRVMSSKVITWPWRLLSP